MPLPLLPPLLLRLICACCFPATAVFAFGIEVLGLQGCTERSSRKAADQHHCLHARIPVLANETHPRKIQPSTNQDHPDSANVTHCCLCVIAPNGTKQCIAVLHAVCGLLLLSSQLLAYLLYLLPQRFCLLWVGNDRLITCMQHKQCLMC